MGGNQCRTKRMNKLMLVGSSEEDHLDYLRLQMISCENWPFLNSSSNTIIYTCWKKGSEYLIMPASLSSHYLRYTAETERHNNCQGAKTAYLPCMEVHVQHACSIHTSVCACRGQRSTSDVIACGDWSGTCWPGWAVQPVSLQEPSPLQLRSAGMISITPLHWT